MLRLCERAANKISVSDDKKHFVELVDASPAGDSLIDECIHKIATAKERARLQTWIGRLVRRKGDPGAN